MECRLGYTPDAWSCQISVRWEFDSTGKRLEEVQEVPFGPRLTDKTLVEPMLRRAQAAILSASGGTGSREAAVARFVGMELEEVRRSTDPKTTGAKALAFSRNTICVDLAGPDLVDLSFVDLPGTFVRSFRLLRAWLIGRSRYRPERGGRGGEACGRPCNVVRRGQLPDPGRTSYER